MPTDVISADYQIADSTGRIWSTTSRFTAEALITHMIDISSVNQCFWFVEADAEILEAFQERTVLHDVRYSDDDRFYRKILIGDKIVEVQFHYSTISLDIAILQDNDIDYPLSTKLIIKVNKNSLFSDGEDIGEFAYFIELHHLLRHNTAVYSEDYQCWKDSPIPMPLFFQLTSEYTTPQDSIIIENAG